MTLNSVVMDHGGQTWITGDGGTLWYATGHGNALTALDSNTANDLGDIARHDGRQYFAVGDAGTLITDTGPNAGTDVDPWSTTTLGAADHTLHAIASVPYGAMRLPKTPPDVLIRDAISHANVTTVPLELRAYNDVLAGEEVYSFDFSSLTTPGVYEAYLAGVGVSDPFVISDDVFQAAAITGARGFYYQRSGPALATPYADFRFDRPENHWFTDGPNDTVINGWFHPSVADSPFYAGESVFQGDVDAAAPTPAEEASSPIDVTGGWFDAGDYGKYVGPAVDTLWHLFTAYEIAPDRFTDGLWNIPESGNGVSDLLDEARVEIEWLRKMQNPINGGVYHKVTRQTWDVGMPHEDARPQFVFEMNTYDTATFAAIAASASRIYASIDPTFAADLLAQAELAWSFLESNPTAVPVNGVQLPGGHAGGDYIDRTDEDNRIWAATELFRTTNNTAYLDFFHDWYDSAGSHPGQDRQPGWKQHYPKAYWAYQATTHASVRSTLQDGLRNTYFINPVDVQVVPRTEMNAYHMGARSDVPVFIGFGSHSRSLTYAWQSILAWHLTSNDDYLEMARINANVQLGANPLSESFVTGLGARYPQRPLHGPTRSDDVAEPIPGLPVFGVTHHLSNGLAAGFNTQSDDNNYPTTFNDTDPLPILYRWWDEDDNPNTAEFSIIGQAVLATTLHIIGPAPTGGTIIGHVFDDADDSGAWATTEGTRAGVVVYIDANNNQTRDPAERFALTNGAGSFAFANVAAGDHILRVEVDTAAFVQTSPAASGSVTVSVGAGTPTVMGSAFGVRKLPVGNVSGVAYDDLNGNGVRDAWPLDLRGNNNGAGTYVFDDALAYEWEVEDITGAGGTIDVANTELSRSGSTSMAVTFDGSGTTDYMAFTWHRERPINFGDYTDVRFYVHGGDEGGQQVRFRIKADGIYRSGPLVTLVADTWTEVTVDLNTFPGPINQIEELIWRKETAGPMPTFYIDEIMLRGDGPAAAVPNTDAPNWAINLHRNTDFSKNAAWVDVTNTFREWGELDAPWQHTLSGPRTLDEGIPIEDAATLGFLWGYPAGDYTLAYEGTGDVALRMLGSPDLVLQNEQTLGGVTTATATLTANPVGDESTFLMLRLQNVDPGDPIRNLRLLVPGYDTSTTQTYRDEYIHRLQPFTQIRAMEWTRTNNSDVVTWTDRTSPDSFIQTGEAGVAWEYVADMANESGKDVWLNIPHEADDDYITQLATLMLSDLDPARRVTVEYSNEIWNPQFDQWRDLNNGDYYGQVAPRLVTIRGIFDAVWGADASRVDLVLSSRAVSDRQFTHALKYFTDNGLTPSDVIDALALNGYFDPQTNLVYDNIDDLFDDEQNLIVERFWFDEVGRLADQHGLDFYTYESGHHITDVNVEPDSLIAAAGNDPRMVELFHELNRHFQEAGGDMMAHFNLFGAGWGLLDHASAPGGNMWDGVMSLLQPDGDATLDGAVTYADFDVLQTNFNQAGWWEQGDFNADRMINGADLLTLYEQLDLGVLSAAESTAITTFAATNNITLPTESLILAIADDVVSQGDGLAATTAVVTRTGDTSRDVVVTITARNPGSRTAGDVADTSVRIKAGNASATFDLDVIDDGLRELAMVVTITATSPGFTSSRDTVRVTDSPLEPGAPGFTVFADLNEDGDLTGDASQPGDEPRTLTDSQGRFTLTDLVGDSVRVVQAFPPDRQQTQPGSRSPAFGYDVTLVDGSTVGGVTFGNQFTDIVPSQLDLLAAFDTGSGSGADADNRTSRNSSDAGSTLQFSVGNTFAGSTVTLYSEGRLIGSTVATGTTTTITTNSDANLVDAAQRITARATFAGFGDTVGSAALFVTIDTKSPDVTIDPLITTYTQPSLTGTVSSGLLDDVHAAINVHVDGNDYAATNNGDGTWSLAADVITALSIGTHDVTVTATDRAGNSSDDPTNAELAVFAELPGSISGDVFVDANGDGHRDGATVFDQVNANGNGNHGGDATNNGGTAAFAHGINMGFHTDYHTTATFVDVGRMFRQWGDVSQSYVHDLSGDVSDQGIPLEDAGALTFMHGYPTGIYKLSYEGIGDVTFSVLGEIVGGTLQTEGGVTTADVLIGEDPLIGPFLLLHLRNVDPADPVRNLRLISPGYDLDSPDVFRSEFVDRLKPFGTLRFMDWAQTNNDGNASDWSQRRTPDHFIQTRVADSYNTGFGGMAWEFMIELANKTQSDAWINVPTLADDNYIRELAGLWRDNLDADRRLIVEYSNEVWNSKQAPYGQTNNGDYYNVVAPKLMTIRNIFYEEWGDDADRLEITLASQAARDSLVENAVRYWTDNGVDPADVVDSISIATYLAAGQSNDFTDLDSLMTDVMDVTDETRWINNHAAIADQHGLRLTSYEGGQHYTSNQATPESLIGDAMTDPRMFVAYNNINDAFAAAGGDLIAWYNFVGRDREGEYWDHLDALDQPGNVNWDAVLSTMFQPGDATTYGTVGFGDFAVARDNWDATNAWWQQGDVDQDGRVWVSDLMAVFSRLDVGELAANELAEITEFTDTRDITLPELGFAMATVYIDANNNGQLDDRELRDVTDGNGAYSLGGVASGDHIVRIVEPDGFVSSLSSRAVIVAAGASATFDIDVTDGHADLSVSVTESTDPVRTGSGTGNLVYELTVTNNSHAPVTNVVVNADMTLPADVTFESASMTAGAFEALTNIAPGIRPGELLIYYGYPSLINGAVGDVATAAADFGRYEHVVLGAGLEDVGHGDHANTVAIMSHAAAANTQFFGYVDLGVSTNNFTLSELRNKVDAWKAAGADGILFDDYGYDFLVTRDRQNAAVEYVHATGLPVIANGFFVDQVFGDAVDATYNPNGLPTALGSTDFYLYESHQIQVGEYTSESTWLNKADSLATYQDVIGFGVMSVTTNDAADTFDADEFNYAWQSAAMFVHASTGWGEHFFSANDNVAPFRSRPDATLGSRFTSSRSTTSPSSTRDTNLGTLSINATTHDVTFTPDADSQSDGDWTINSLAPDSSAKLTLTLTVGQDAPIGTDAVSLTGALVTADQLDTDVNNNTAFESTTIRSRVPVLAIADLNYTEGDNNGLPVAIDSTAVATDPDAVAAGNTEWDGGTLTVQLTTNAESTDELSIAAPFTITAGDLLSDGTPIATLSETSGTPNDGIVTGSDLLTITFNANATNALVQNVTRSLSYRTMSTAPSTATRTFTVTDTDSHAETATAASSISVTSIADTPTVTAPASVLVVNSDKVTISGTSEPRALIKVYTDANNDGVINGEDVVTATTQLTGDATSFTLDVDLTRNAANNFVITATDASGDESSAADVPTVTEDSTVPSVTITGPATPTSADPFVVIITFSEPITGFVSTDITVTNGSVASFARGAGNTFTATINATNDGEVTAFVPVNIAADAANNPNTKSPTFAVTVDTTAPAPVITTTVADSTNASTFAVSINFGEAVHDFVLADIELTNATADNFVDVGNGVFTIDVEPLADGDVTINVVENVATDTASNSNLAAASFTIHSDRTSPSVIVGFARQLLTVAQDRSVVSFAFSEPVTGFTIDDVAPSHGTLEGFSGNGREYSAEFVAEELFVGIGAVEVGTDYSDAAGNAGTVGQDAVDIDTQRPTVLSFARQQPTTTPTDADVLIFRVTFSEAVTNLDTTDFAVNSDLTATINSASSVSVGVYDVTVSGGDLAEFQGSVGLDLRGDHNIQDAVGNVLGTDEPDIDEVFVVEQTVPAILVNKTFLIVAENGNRAVLTVKLNSRPTEDVVLVVTSSDITEATVSPAELHFTPDEWHIPQPVTVIGQPDEEIADGDVELEVTVAVNPAVSDAAYHNVESAVIDVLNRSHITHRRFTLRGTGRVTDVIDVRSTNGNSGIDIELRSAEGAVISPGLTGSGRLSFAGLPPGVYELWVNDDTSNYEVTVAENLGEAEGLPESPALDLDGNSAFRFAEDGLVLFGVASDVPSSTLEDLGAQDRTRTGDEMRTTSELLADSLDIDGDGQFVFSHDGVILLAYVFGLRSTQLEPFRSPGATRTGAQMEARLEGLLSSSPPAAARQQSQPVANAHQQSESAVRIQTGDQTTPKIETSEEYVAFVPARTRRPVASVHGAAFWSHQHPRAAYVLSESMQLAADSTSGGMSYVRHSPEDPASRQRHSETQIESVMDSAFPAVDAIFSDQTFWHEF